MNDILFISDVSINPELELAKREILQHGFSISAPSNFDAAYQLISREQVFCVLINAIENKFEAYDFCLKLQSLQQAKLKIFVYLQGASANEASKFGKLNAEVVDAISVQTMIESLKSQSQTGICAKQNLTSIISLDGGLGVSTLALLLSNIMTESNSSSILIESNHKFTIRAILGIESQHSFLGRDRSLEHKQTYDKNWFGAFLSQSNRGDYKYLNLFSNLGERMDYLEGSSVYARIIANALDKLDTKGELDEQIKTISKSIEVLARDIKGDPTVLFDELVRFALHFADQLIIDLGQDIFSSLNKQFLAMSKNIIILFADKPGTKINFASLKRDFEQRYGAKLIPILVTDEINHQYYTRLKSDEWLDLIGITPLIWQREPEIIAAFIYDNEAIVRSSKTYKLLQRLLQECSIKTPNFSAFNGGAFKFLKYV